MSAHLRSQHSIPAHNPADDGGCCGCRRNKGVAPFPEFDPNYDFIEIRPRRFLRIRHVNLRSHCNPLTARGPPQSAKLKRGSVSDDLHGNSVQHPNAYDGDQEHTPEHSGVITHTTIIDDNPTYTTKPQSNNNTFKQQGAHQKLSDGLPAHTTNSPARTANLKLQERTRTASSVDIKLHRSGATATSHMSPQHVPSTSHVSPQHVPSTSHVSPQHVPPASSMPVPTHSASGPTTSGKHATHSQGDTTHASSTAQGGETVIFLLHGVGGSSDVWQAQIDHLGALGYPMVIPDLIGHGFSQTPRDKSAYKFHEILNDIHAVFDRYSKKKNIVIGHSYGCSFAAVLARSRPGLVSKLILISGGSPTPLAPQPGLFQMPVCVLSCCKPILLRGFKKSAFHDPGGATKRHASLGRAFDIPTYVLKYTMNGQTWEEGDAVFHSYITAPTLIIHGKEDRLIPEEDEEEMADTIQGAKMVVVENASHMVMMERPELVNRLILEFVSDDVIPPPTVTSASRSRHLHPSRRVSHSAMSLRSVKSIPNTETLVTSNLK